MRITTGSAGTLVRLLPSQYENGMKVIAEKKGVRAEGVLVGRVQPWGEVKWSFASNERAFKGTGYRDLEYAYSWAMPDGEVIYKAV